MNDQSLGETRQGDMKTLIEGRPWWKTCLIIAAITLAALIVTGIILFRVFSGSGPRPISELPDSFPPSFVLYRPEAIHDMYYYPASAKQRPFALALVPIKLLAGVSDQARQLSGYVEQGTASLRNTDTVSITWTGLDADAEEVLLFYAGAMKQVGVEEPQIRQSEDGNLSEMVGSTNDVNVNVLVDDRPGTDAIDTISLIVEYRVSE